MSKVRVILLTTLRVEKFPAGPTTPNPGPMLLRHEATDENVVLKSKPSKETIRTEAEKIIEYKTKNTPTEATV